jgi:sulfite dehydrogenase (cytochrome) subunit A
MNRRRFLELAATGAASLTLGPGARAAQQVTMPFANGERELVTYPGKSSLIRITARPPCLETPFDVFNEGVITPNRSFFVRYHLAGLPEAIDPATYRLEVGGKVKTPLSLALNELKSQFDPVEIIAVNQCSGNSRGFFEPRVPGGQFGNGAMGNARWKGVPLKAVLNKAGLERDAIEVSFAGLDRPVLPGTPEFVKSLTLDEALGGDVLLAYAMNGEDLPFLNGHPLRLVVPGYYGTYWIKHLAKITVLDKPFEGFWMKSAYRIAANDCHCTEPGAAPSATVPIGRCNVRSFITSLKNGDKIRAGSIEISGIAFDGGNGIAEVLVSAGEGLGWSKAKLGENLGRYSFRRWTLKLSLPPGKHTLRVRAVSRSGETQPVEPRWNSPGYMRNNVESTLVHAT